MSGAGTVPEARQRYAAASAMGLRSKLPEITYGHKICVAYSTVPINNNLGKFVFLINSFFWAQKCCRFIRASAGFFPHNESKKQEDPEVGCCRF